MSCPCFSPRQPRARDCDPQAAPLPLGDVWTGLCLAQPAAPAEPGEDRLPLCNLGYARGVCPRFPATDSADAVRFAIVRDDGRSLQIYYARERGHLPFDHGQIEFHRDGDTFQPALGATAFGDQARAYVASYLSRLRRRRSAAARPE